MIDLPVLLVVGVIVSAILPPHGADTDGLIFLGTFLIYVAVCTAAFGGTLGKRLLGLRVEADGGNLSVLRSVVRTFAYVPSVFLRGYISIFRDDRRRALHDRWTHTVVMREAVTTRRAIVGSLLVAVVLVLVGISIFGASNDPDAAPVAWTLVAPDGLAFSVEFPREPKTTTIPDGAKRYLAALEDGSTFGLWVMPFSPEDEQKLAAASRSDAEYEQGLERTVRDFNDDAFRAETAGVSLGPLTFQPVSYAFNPTVEFTATIGSEVLRGRAIYTDRGIYMFEAAGPAKFADRYARFVTSAVVH